MLALKVGPPKGAVGGMSDDNDAHLHSTQKKAPGQFGVAWGKVRQGFAGMWV